MSHLKKDLADAGTVAFPTSSHVDEQLEPDSSLTAKSSIVGYVDGYVKHGHQRHGLGNVLFMINAALVCASKVALINSSNVLRGTSNAFGRHRSEQPYTSTLLRRFRLVQRRPGSAVGTLRGGQGRTAPLPSCPNTSFVTRTFAQSPPFVAHVPRLLRLLSWPTDLWTRPRVASRYVDLRDGTCVGVRAGRDFSHRPIRAAQYRRALDQLSAYGESIQPLFVLGDVPNAWAPFESEVGFGPATQIDEDDVTQLALGRHCRNFVLSQSSFHVWMAYAAIRPRHVLLFNGTDPINAGIAAPAWVQTPWVVLSSSLVG